MDHIMRQSTDPETMSPFYLVYFTITIHTHLMKLGAMSLMWRKCWVWTPRVTVALATQRTWMPLDGEVLDHISISLWSGLVKIQSTETPRLISWSLISRSSPTRPPGELWPQCTRGGSRAFWPVCFPAPTPRPHQPLPPEQLGAPCPAWPGSCHRY